MVERGQVAVVVSNVGEEPPQAKRVIEETARREAADEGTPDPLVQGGDKLGGLLAAFPTNVTTRSAGAGAPPPAPPSQPKPPAGLEKRTP